ncbi:MAG: peptide deformylase [Deltaproteobacteria bacterium]|nr:peptide deformylase [Deltaproteobacteria bacterium]
MAIRRILLLGNPMLYEISEPVLSEEIQHVHGIVSDLHDTLIEFRERHGVGRAIAAPQIGVMKRIIYMFVNDASTVFINPELDDLSQERFDVWDDCMCFPDLLVRVRRHQTCRIRFRNLNGEEEQMMAEGHLSELLQHEYDHLNGILAVSRAIDGQSFALRR